jgi:hypothetical protein
VVKVDGAQSITAPDVAKIHFLESVGACGEFFRRLKFGKIFYGAKVCGGGAL